MTIQIDAMTWLNKPPFQQVSDRAMTVRSGLNTDFWQGTYYGFHRDDGHFLYCNVEGEFTVAATFSGAYETLYDQAGLMLRVDPTHWIKCGIELTDGAQHFSVVVTNGYSDWSAQKLLDPGQQISVRMTRIRDTVFIQYHQDGEPWQMARLAYFPSEFSNMAAGMAFCSPQRAGFEATYTGFEITDPVLTDIHS